MEKSVDESNQQATHLESTQMEVDHDEYGDEGEKPSRNK